MRTTNVEVNGDIYTLTAVTADISGAISIELISDFAPLVTSLFDGNIDALNKELRTSLNSEKVMRCFLELINPINLKKNKELVKDWKEEFQCKPFTLMQLGYEAMRFNCEDFFTFISGFVTEKIAGINWKEIIKSLEEQGVQIPQITSLLLQNGEEDKTQNSLKKKSKKTTEKIL